jgi:outer membrane lipoprotein-sorting protein
MKKLIAIISFIALATNAMAQTAEEIITRMEAEMSKHDESEGTAMTMDMKIIFVGTISSRNYVLGDKMRIEAINDDGKNFVTWSDGKTEWVYDSEKNEIEITNAKPKEKSETNGDTKLFQDITDGYEVKIDKETATEWHIRCKRSKSNPDKDAPKRMDLVVAKGTYWPVSLSTSVTAATVTLRDISFGVTEEQVTFNPKEFPNATIIDKR